VLYFGKGNHNTTCTKKSNLFCIVNLQGALGDAPCSNLHCFSYISILVGSALNLGELRRARWLARACKGTVFSSIDVVKSLVDKTSTLTGLKVFSTIKDKIYETGRKVIETFKENMKIVFDDYLGKLNYKAIPNIKT
jgi:hypothetical protein